MGFQVLTGPTELFLTLAEVKDQLRVEVADDDAFLEWLIQATGEAIEKFIRHSLITRTLKYTFKEFPSNGKIKLPFSPVQSITSLKYLDLAGVEQTWAASNYLFFDDMTPAVITRAYGVSWPSVRDQLGAIRIEYVAGYGKRESVPKAIRHAARLIIGHFYERRENTTIGQPITEIPNGAATLLWPYRIFKP